MRKPPYSRFKNRELTLNDYLAVDRTILANERSLLAYARTGLALAAVGGSCIKFFDSPWMTALGVALLMASVGLAFIGWRSFKRTQSYLAAVLEETTGAPEHPLKEAVEAEAKKSSESSDSPTVPT